MAIGTRRHRLLTGDNVGSIVRWTVADSTARLALALTADDNGAIAKQTDDTSYHILADYSTPTWVKLARDADLVSSASDPTVGDDELDGYVVGTIWVNTTTPSAFILVDKSAGAAVWLSFIGVTALSGAADPGVATGNGYPLGTIYVNTTSDAPFFLVDNTAGANVWSAGGGGGGGGTWGSITGTLSAQTDLQAALDAKVTGPASAVDDSIARFDGVTGKLIKDGTTSTLNDNGHMKLLGSQAAIDLTELATGPTSNPATGHFWVKNSAPTTPRFTDDAAGEHTLLLDNGEVAQQRVTFDTAPASPPTAEGTMYWDASDHTLSIKPDVSAATMQVGQENWVRVYNDTGVLIANGSIVYISGAEGVEGRPTVALAQANAAASSKVLGAVTADIGIASFGYVTQFGLVRDVNTLGFTPGNPVYLSPTAAGGFTETEPGAPNYSVFLGYVVVADAANGVGFITTLGNTGSAPAGGAKLLTIPARKGSVGTITTGQAVYVSGYNIGQEVLEVELADADGTGTMPAIGLAAGSITNSANGIVITSGIIPDVNTAAFSVGDALYVSDTAGGLTNVKPTDGSLIQKVGLCVRSNASNGAILVTGAGRSNDITNSIYLPEQADHLKTPAAGYAELWVNNAATQSLVFTDDAGADRLVAGAIAADITDNALATWNGTTGKLDSTTLSTFGATLIDDTDAATARTTLDAARAMLSGAGAPGVSTGNGYPLGTTYADTTNDAGYILVDATTDVNVWWTSTPETHLLTHSGGVNPIQDTWRSWHYTEGPYNTAQTSWNSASGSSGTGSRTVDPEVHWYHHGLYIPRAITITGISSSSTPSGAHSSHDLYLEFWAHTTADGATTDPTGGSVFKVANVNFTVDGTVNKHYKKSYTINNGSIPAGHSLNLYFTTTSAAGVGIKQRYSYTIEYTVD